MRHPRNAARGGFHPFAGSGPGGPRRGGPGPRAFGPGPDGPAFGPGPDPDVPGPPEFGPGFGPDPRGFGPGPRGFGRGPRGFGRGGARARRGDVRSAILGLLADGPDNGYGLIKAIGERTGGAWQPSPGSVYPTLAQLVDEGLVGKADGPRGAYSLSEAGQEYVSQHREVVDAAFSNARGAGEDVELREAVRKLMASAAQFRDATPDQRTRAVAKIDQLRRDLYAILAE